MFQNDQIKKTIDVYWIADDGGEYISDDKKKSFIILIDAIYYNNGQLT